MNVDYSRLQVGNVLGESQYYKVDKIVGDQVQLSSDSGDTIVVTKEYVESFLSSADQFNSTEQVTRTALADIVKAAARSVMTVNFNKQVKEADIVKEVIEAYGNSTPKSFEASLKKSIKRGLSGEERTMVGRHYGDVDDFGRIHFVDMSLDKGTNPKFDGRLRLVDPRTLNWAIIQNVKYIVK
jgi:hypothetical protein